MTALLAKYRVLDLTDARGAFAGSLLAQLGAEVILVEPPTGNNIRKTEPYAQDKPDLDNSLVHHSFSRGKASVMLDPNNSKDKKKFLDLASSADVILRSGRPSEIDALGYPSTSELEDMFPHLVQATVSPFGLTGPKAEWLDSDLVLAAAGVQMSINGDADAPPLRTAVPQVWSHACADAAIGVAVALRERSHSQLGQRVDVSAQQSWTYAAFHYPLFPSWGAEEVTRNGSHVRIGKVASTFHFPAKDGTVTLTYLFGAAVGPFTNRFVEWMVDEGAIDPAFQSIDYSTWSPVDDLDHYEKLTKAIYYFCESKTKAELLEAAKQRRLLVMPVSTLSEVISNTQFEERGLWESVQIGESSAKLPGPFVHAIPRLPSLGSAPKIGENQALLQNLEPKSFIADTQTKPFKRPLDGVKVLDMTISFAGPTVGRTLADHGATVIKVESEHRPDLTRTAGVFLNGDGVDNSACFAEYNAGKKSIALDLSKKESSIPILHELVKWADVLIESFAPGSLGRLGLDSKARKNLNPNLVTLQSTMVGQTGPFSSFPGYGNMAAALCGFFATTGWPGRLRVGPVGAYTDIISPRFAVLAVLSALDHLEATGNPTDFDFGQGESAIQLLNVGLLDSQINGRQWEGIGNADHFLAPHGVYPCSEEDTWVAVSCSNDEQWELLSAYLKINSLKKLSVSDRLMRQEEINAAIEAWTTQRSSKDAAETLQQLGVAAHQVQGGKECALDEQLRHRNWTVNVDHELMGSIPVRNSAIHLSRTPALISEPGPRIGQHTFEILLNNLNKNPDQIAELAIKEIFE